MRECKKCGVIWNNKLDSPKECPRCKSKDWNKPRVYTKREVIDYSKEVKKDFQNNGGIRLDE